MPYWHQNFRMKNLLLSEDLLRDYIFFLVWCPAKRQLKNAIWMQTVKIVQRKIMGIIFENLFPKHSIIMSANFKRYHIKNKSMNTLEIFELLSGEDKNFRILSK